MNFPGNVSPPRAAAFFDLDGTLIAEPSLERRLYAVLRSRREIPIANYVRWAAHALRLLPRGLAAVQHANKRYLCDVRCDRVLWHLESLPIFEEAIARLGWHSRQGHELVLITGTLEPLAHMAATALECELEARGIEAQIQVCASRLEEVHGRWTGRLLGDAMFGETKRRAMLDYAKRRGLDLRDCHAYGNSPLDAFMLSAAGDAHAVNPNKQLATLANLYDWTIWHWHLEKNLPSNPAAEAGPEAKIQQLESQV
jgi:phosphoserine phosphatase